LMLSFEVLFSLFYIFSFSFLLCWFCCKISSHFLLNYVWSFNRSAYLNVFKLWSDDELPGDTHAIITTLHKVDLLIKESRRINVSFEARKGTWSALSSIARIHSFKANKLNFK
jgi:hypothetical protein